MDLDRVLKNPDISPIALASFLSSKYKQEWVTDDFLHVLMLAEEDLGGTHPLVSEKIRALRVCAHTAAPWKRMEVFNPVVHALLGVPVFFDRWTVLEPHQLALGMHTIDSLRREVFSPEVSAFVAACLMTKGLHIIPVDILMCAKEYLRPHNPSAQEVFNRISRIPIEEVELDTNIYDNNQALYGRAEAEMYQHTLEEWSQQTEQLKRLLL